jgi:phosphate transport system permease protein
MSIRTRHLTERIMVGVMQIALGIALASVVAIIGIILFRGCAALSWDMVTKTPSGRFYLGEGGGIANAIVGSVYLAFGSTVLAAIVSLPIAFALQKRFMPAFLRRGITVLIDVLWGVPSVVVGAFCFLVMAHYGLRTSLGGGIFTLTLVIMPIMVRGMAEAIATAPAALNETACALGATRFEILTRVLLRQTLPGIVTAVLLAFGRGIGDAASLLFTAGYSDYIPRSLGEPAASLPLAIFFQLTTPVPAVQQRAYAAALILLIIVFAVTAGSRAVACRIGKHVVR